MLVSKMVDEGVWIGSAAGDERGLPEGRLGKHDSGQQLANSYHHSQRHTQTHHHGCSLTCEEHGPPDNRDQEV